jgi:nucleoside-diphosphate-sugar epimerase
MQQILVVGKGGTLGAAIARRLDCEAIELRITDPRDRTPVDEVARADVVVNAAGPRVRPGLAWADYFREHVGVASRVLRSMRPGAHVVHISSCAVYGARGALVGTDDVEAPTLFPAQAYACAKLAAEAEVRALGRSRGVRVTVLRPSMVYGPGIESALDSIRRLSSRGLRLRLEPAHVRQHLLHIELLLDAVSSATKRTPDEERVLVLADPFVLTSSDLVPRSGLTVVVPLRATTALHALARRFGHAPPSTEAFAILAMDNEFVWRPAFEALQLDPAEYTRARTFDRYWSANT